jgi:hypothetical protein
MCRSMCRWLCRLCVARERLVVQTGRIARTACRTMNMRDIMDPLMHMVVLSEELKRIDPDERKREPWHAGWERPARDSNGTTIEQLRGLGRRLLKAGRTAVPSRSIRRPHRRAT